MALLSESIHDLLRAPVLPVSDDRGSSEAIFKKVLPADFIEFPCETKPIYQLAVVLFSSLLRARLCQRSPYLSRALQFKCGSGSVVGAALAATGIWATPGQPEKINRADHRQNVDKAGVTFIADAPQDPPAEPVSGDGDQSDSEAKRQIVPVQEICPTKHCDTGQI